MTYSGSITGSGKLIVNTSDSTLTLPGGYTVAMGYGDPAPKQQVILTLANGAWSTDFSHEILANHHIVVSGAATIELPPGITTDTARIAGSGPLTITSATGGSTLIVNGASIVIPNAGQSEVFTVANGVLSIDLTSLVASNADITLGGVSSTINLGGGTTHYAGTLNGQGAITLVAGSAPSTFVLKDGTTFTLAAGATETAILSPTGWHVDATAALLANKPIALSVATSLILPAGTISYTGALSGGASLTLTSANITGGSTLVAGGHTFTLPSPNETLTATLSGGVWTTDVSAALAANQNIVLGGGNTIATLPVGASTYSGTVGGTGSLTLTSASSGGSTITLRNNGATFVLPSAGETETATLGANGVWSVDVSSVLRAGQGITLTTNATATLPAGTTSYNGMLTGTGVLTVTASAYPATLAIPGVSSVVLTASDPTEIVTVTNGIASADIGAALAASQNIVLSGTSTATLSSGTTIYRGTITGSGTIKLTSGTNGGTLVVGGNTFALPAAGETETLSLANSLWSVDITEAIHANQAVTLTGPTTLALGGGTTNYTGTLGGTGTLTVTSPPSSTSTLLIGGTTLYLPSPGESQTLAVTNGAIASVDVTAAFLANQNISLSIPATAKLPVGATLYTGTLNGGAPLTLTSGGAGASSLTLANGTTFTLPNAGESETFLFANNSWTANATSAFVAGLDIALNQPTTINLPNGVSTYHGTITGTAPLILVSGGAGSSTTIGGQTFVLPAAGETETLSYANGVWTADISAVVRANQAITLTGPTIVALGGGTTTYTGTLAGTGTILFTSPANSGASVVLSASGQTLYLPAGGYSEIATVTNGVVTSVDLGAALLANKNITLGVPATITLPAGTTTYVGQLSGTGTLTVTSGATGGSILVIETQTFVLPAANETETLSFANNVWSADITAALLANKAVVLTTNATATLPAGATHYTGTVSGQGILTVTGKAGAASSLDLGGATTFDVATGQTQRQTLNGGQWSSDVTAQILANQNIVLNGSAAVYLPASVNYTGTISGQGTLVVTSPSNSGATLSLNGAPFLSIPAVGQTETLKLANGTWTQDVTALVLANKSVTITVPATLVLPAGTTQYTGSLNGSGSLTITAGASGGSILEVAGGRTFILPAAGESETIAVANGQWVSNVSVALTQNQAITLTGPATGTLAAGTTTYTGALAGVGRLTLVASKTASSTLVIGGASVTVVAAQSMVVTLVNGAVATDLSAALASGQPLTLNGPAAALLPAGTTTYSGGVTGSGTLTLVSANNGAGSTLVIGSQRFALPASNETQTLTFANGAWTTDLSEAVENNQAIALDTATPASIQLLTGIETDRAAISGAGTITLTAANGTGGSTLVSGGHTFVLGAAGETETATLANGVWTTDVTAALLASQPITLSGANTAALPAGTTIYNGAITGSGTLTLTSPSTGPSTLVIGGQTFTLLAGNETETLTLSGAGAWSIDVSAALASNQAIALSTIPTTATLSAGTTTYTGAISGAGTLTLTSSAAGASTFVIGAERFVLPAAGETETLIRTAAGAWSLDVTAAVLAKKSIALSGLPTVVNLPGSVSYSGSLSGTGTIAVSTGAAGGANFSFGGNTALSIAGPKQTQVLSVTNGVVTSVDVTSALLANQNINVGLPTTATLPVGTTAYTGSLNVGTGSSLTLTSGNGAAALVLTNGTTFSLPNAGETERFTYTNGWTADATAAALAGDDIVLNQPTTITLPDGVTRTGTITGTAPLILVAGPNGGALRLADGTVFTLPGANETETVSLANGIWTTDLSAALKANLPITLNGTAVATLGTGTTSVTSAIEGSGTLKLTSANATGGSTLVLDGQSFILPSANESEVLTLSGGVWSVDVTSAINNRQAIVLNGAETVHLNAGGTFTGASITGTGSLLVTSNASGPGTLQLGSSYIGLPDANETVTVTPTATGWSEDVSAAFLTNQDITLNYSTPAKLTLRAGTTTYTGTINGSGTLTVTAGGTGGSTLVIGMQTFALPSAGESETLTLANGTWSIDVSAALLSSNMIVLNETPTVATLAAGTTTYAGAISGTGAIVLTAGGSGGSTLILADGTRFTLPAAGETATAILANGLWSLDVSAAVLANAPLTLSGTTFVTLPNGTTTYTGVVNGSGRLTLVSNSSNGNSTFVIGSQTVSLPGRGESETLVFTNGAWINTEITAAVTANKNVVLTGPSSMMLPAGVTVDTATITGSGSLTLATGATGGSLRLVNGPSFVLPDAGETETATLANGIWTTDVSTAVSTGHAVSVTGNTVATLASGTTHISSLTGSGTLSLTSSAQGGSTLVAANGTTITIAGANQSVVVNLVNDVASVDVTAQLAANQAIVLGSNATVFLPAGQSAYSSALTGSGTLTLFGSTIDDSTITFGGTTYTVPVNTALTLTETNGGFAPSATTDISAAIAANQQSIIFTGGKYVIDVPLGQTFTYTGLMSGIGTLEVTGGGTLLLENNSTFTLPPDQQHEYATSGHNLETVYDGIDLGYDSSSNISLHGQNAPVVTIDKGTTLDFGDPTGTNTGYGNISSLVGGFGESYNTDNILDNGTLNVSYSGGAGYALNLGELSGDGLVTNALGAVFAEGTSNFSGRAVLYSFNIGGGHGNGSLGGATSIDNSFVLAYSTTLPTTDGSSSGQLVIADTIYEQHFGASIHNLGPGPDIFTGRYSYNDSGSQITPSLSDDRLNYMYINGNAANHQFYTATLQQFGNGTNADFFLPGNQYNSQISINANGTLGFDYNGTVIVDAPIQKGIGNNLNIVLLGTVGNHIIFTQAEGANGLTQIDKNAILQLGDGTGGNSSTITVSGQTGIYSTSNGNGSILTAESAGGSANDSIVDNGQLIVDNVDGALDGITPITLSHISGTGSFLQQGTQLVTLLEDTTYTGETDIANGTLALADTSGWTSIESSSGVVLQNAAAGFDISQAGNQTIEDLTGAAGSTVSLGGNRLTLGTMNDTVFSGQFVDGGIGSGTGGSLLKTNGGTLELSGNSTFTGMTDVEGGTLQLDGISLASAAIKVSTGALLTGSGTLAGTVDDEGTVVAAGGLLSLGSVTGPGKLEIAAGATLALIAGGNQTVTFDGAGALVLGQPSHFSGAIGGFGSGSKIDLAGLTVTNAVYSAAAGMLDLMNGSTQVEQLAINPGPAGDTFTVESDGRGGSVIAEAAPQTAPATGQTTSIPSSGLALAVSEDAYGGDARFTVTVNGVKQSGVYTVTALHSQGQTQTFVIPGSFGTGRLNVGVSFINDANGGSPSLDRNLYVNAISDYGVTFAANAVFEHNGTKTFTVDGSTTYNIGAPDKIALELSEDAYRGDAQFTVIVDGVQQGGPQTVTALHSAGQSQEFDITGNFGNGAHTVAVDFLNDRYAGSASTDRNLYVTSITYDGQTTVENSAQLSAGTKAYTGLGLGVDNVTATDTTLTSTGADTINAGSGTDTFNLFGPSATVNGGTGTDTILANGADTINANDAVTKVIGNAGSLTFIGGSAAATVVGGSGTAVVNAGSGSLGFTAGTGNATVTFGSGADLLSFINGSAGGTTIVNAFTQGVDRISLKGYDSAAVSQAIDQSTVSGGSTTVMLPDHSKIVLSGISSIDHASFHTA